MNLVKQLFALLILSLMANGCATLDPVPTPKDFTNYKCRLEYGAGKEESADQQLDRVSSLYEKACFKEVVRLGTFVREQSRDKIYSLTGELVEFIAPEGKATPYVLESYERSLLSLLIAMSHMQLGHHEGARVELMRGYQEEGAYLYNHGTDPVMALMQAALWDRYEPENARPLWRQLSEFPGVDSSIKSFAVKRMEEIDRGGDQRVHWRIYQLGRLPGLDWGASEGSASADNHYSIRPKEKFPLSCSEPDEVMMPTKSWVDKIGIRTNADYHPLVYAKSMIRFPFAAAAGIVGYSAGTAVIVAGVAAGIHEGKSEIIEASFNAGGSIFEGTGNLVDYVLAPDLRHWTRLPSAILVTRSEIRPFHECLFKTQPGLSAVALIE